ncbi:MAG: EAL domain-containing protein, partial [Colwellia sp.]|nr:EAL domain-containing protein [Colwellia sp.]
KGLHTLSLEDNNKKVKFSRISVRGHNNKLKEIKTIFQDQKQNYWLGSYENGIHLISKNLAYLGSLQEDNIFDLTVDADALFDIKSIANQYWLATNNGLFIISDDYKLLSHLTADQTSSSTTQPLLSNNIRAITQYDDTHVWLATQNGLNTINLLDDNVHAYQNSKNISSLSENWLMDMYQDKNGNMWLASYGGGLNKYSPLTALFYHGLSSDEEKSYRVQSFTETTDGAIWLSTEQQGLFRLIKDQPIEPIQTPLNKEIRQIISDKNSNLWIRSKTGKLFLFDPDLDKLTEHKQWAAKANYSNNKPIILIDESIWFIDDNGNLSHYQTTNKTVKNYPTNNRLTFRHLQKGDNSLLWLITSENKLVLFNVEKEIYDENVTNLDKVAEITSVNSINIGKLYTLFGSESQGLSLLNKQNNTLTHYNESNTLKNNYIASIVFDEKEIIWLATNSGITAINPEKQNLIHFDLDFGIHSPEFSQNIFIKSAQEELFFGSPNGFYQFNPEEVLRIKQKISKPLFTNLYVANKKIDVVNAAKKAETHNEKYTIAKQLNSLPLLELAYKQSPISFEFVSPNAKLPAQVRYRYRLVGLEQNWIDAATDTGRNNHRATYTNLSAGDYVFEVQAYDLNHPEHTKTSQLNVHILPPWWLSTSAMFVYTLVSILILVYVVQQYRNKLLYNSQIKESEERLKLSLWGSGDEMWDWNIATDKVYHTNTWSNLAFPQDSTRNANAETNIHHQDLTRVKQALTEHLEGKNEHFEATYRVKDKNERWIWILDRGKIVEHDENNKPTRMTGTLKDISHIKKAEERLKLFARCIQNISDAVVIYDRQFIAVDVNKAFQRITGKSKNQMVGRTMSFSQYPNSFSQNIKKHLLTQGSWHGEIESIRANGKKYLTDLNIDIIHDDTGSISHFVGVFSDITKRKETEAELRKLASSDTLTGLPNRSFFQANQARLVKNKINHALLVFDLDNFKKINDSMGHQVGDSILCQVAKRMLALGRKQDTVYRLGGDEFSIIIEGTNDIHTITSLAKNILQAIGQPFKLKNQEIVLYSSIGIVLFPEDGNTGHELLKNADTAMYHAKGSGGNKYQFFSESMNKQAVKRLQIENLIRHGLKEDAFSVFYQPKIEIATGKVAGMEALVRFETPSKGVVSPIVFIPVSEETGQIIDIGEIVLRKACYATKKWVDAGLFDGRVAVNLSAVQFTQANLVGQIADILKESQLPAKHLELEITEGTVMDSPQAAIDTMLQIRAMGVHLSLDDFGTGYSSLAYLKKFPLNTLKIDKAFVDDIELSEQGRNMVATIVTIAHNLGMDVVAEGVETNQQLSFLSGLRCELLQGYLYSKPLATEQFQKYLLAHQIAHKSTSFNQNSK